MATSDPLAQDPDCPPIKRQAVVIVHGQGEQRPMGTIRSFVETLWTFDHELELKDPPEPDRDPNVSSRIRNPSWIVPDDRGQLYDVHRVTCPELKQDKRRTDFFELYYADLFNMTPVRTLWLWLQRLAWIDPRHVTPAMRIPWGTFWVLSSLTVAAFLCAFYLLLMQFSEFKTAVASVWRDPLLPLSVLLIAIMLAIRVIPRLALFRSNEGPGHFSEALTNVPRWALYLGIFAGLVLVMRGYLLFWLVSFVALILVVGFRLLLPYFGDAASYLSAHTETVQSRQHIRERGLGLLRALQEDDKFDRIIIVAHSLGTVLAYDLLHILWNDLGPTKENPPSQQAQAALAAVDRFVKAHQDDVWSEKNLAPKYQKLQWAVFDQLRRQKGPDPAQDTGAENSKPGWKISDFVTMGSPLTSAQFLIADGPDDFERLKKDRLMPTSPAQPFDDKQQAAYKMQNGSRVAHHGAVFSTVRWTNIYDPFPPRLFLLGDPISGPVSGNDRFGQGIMDWVHRIRRHEGDAGTSVQRWELWARRFTHNHYWTNTNGNWKKPSAHIVTLRNAVNLQAK